MKRGEKGFTLIELLIVVAIIAILAAIAVPNFLEAQTRAKVSRVHADMRSIATAIESYAVDFGVPPLGDRNLQLPDNANARGRGYIRTLGQIYGQMTTPVSYMSTIPKDPFVLQTEADQDYVGFQYQDYVAANPKWGGRWDYSGRAGLPFGTLAADKANRRGYQWSLESFGPRTSTIKTVTWAIMMTCAYSPGGSTPPVNPALYGPNPIDLCYDATNGTISIGAIVRTNKGIYPSGDSGKQNSAS